MPAVYDGGFIGHVYAEKTSANTYEATSVSIVGCVFEGTITSTENTYFGGFVGKAEGVSSVATAAVTITDSLFDPRAINVTRTEGSETFAITGNYSSVTTEAGDHGRKLYKDGAWNTLCLPFDMTVEQLAAAKTTEGHPLYGATIWEMDVTGWYNTSNQRSDTKNATFCYQTALSHQPSNISPQPSYLLYLYFQNATAIEAGKAYIVKWDKPDG